MDEHVHRKTRTLADYRAFREAVSKRARYKRPFDLFFLVASHIILAPILLVLWLLIPLAILIDDGLPIFYRSEKVGFRGSRFTALKFRSMVKDASETGPSYTRVGDPRVTRVGWVLRKTALDELPQVTAIALGHMSWVGPRAWGVHTHEQWIDDKPRLRLRLEVKPGLTSMAALYADPANKDSWLEHDLMYMRHMTPLLDLKLLFTSLCRAFVLSWERNKQADR